MSQSFLHGSITGTRFTIKIPESHPSVNAPTRLGGWLKHLPCWPEKPRLLAARDYDRMGTMNMKDHILAALGEQLDRWEELLSRLSEEQIGAARFDHNWSIKDVIVHLWAWQQASVARLEGAVLGRTPEFPVSTEKLGAGWEEDADRTNARLYGTCHQEPWTKVCNRWRSGFSRLLELGELVPERNLLDGDRYARLNGYSLAFTLVDSYDHHQEHLEKLLPWLDGHGR